MMAEHQKQNMRQHLVAVRDIVNALSASDCAAVEKFAAALGTTPEMARTCNVMGAATPGFSEQALAFHRTADGSGEAARRGEQAEVMMALGKTLEACTACHATYRQEVVNQETRKELTKGQGG
jgi:cytochrome c556